MTSENGKAVEEIVKHGGQKFSRKVAAETGLSESVTYYAIGPAFLSV